MSQSVQAACDCGSRSSNSVCTGNSIAISVPGQDRNIRFNWLFNSNGNAARCGQFANGDFWVAPAPGQTSVEFTGITQTGGEDIFVDENPTPEKMAFLAEGYSKRVRSGVYVSNHDPSENIVPNLPQRFSGKTSLVAAVERDQSSVGRCGTNAIRQGCVDAYNVVTVLDVIPENAGSTVLRPNIVRAQKELMSLSEFDLTRLPQKSFFSKADAEGLENIRRSWAHHTEVFSMRDKRSYGYSEGGRAFRAHMLVDDYAAGVAVKWHNNLANLMAFGYAAGETSAALASMLTYAKDIYYHVYSFSGERERWFGVGAGQSLGRFPAAVFFAALANDDQFGEVLALASSTQLNLGGESVHELDQVNLGPNGPTWGDGDADVPFDQFETGRYWGEMLIGQQFNGARHRDVGKKTGQRTKRDPYRYIDGPGQFPGISYAGVSAGPIRALGAMMLLMPRMCEFVNYDPLVEYSLRISRVGRQIDNDPCAPPDPRELTGDIIAKLKANNVPGADDLKACDTFRLNNCKYYGLDWDPNVTGAPTWGPNPDDRSLCITNGVDPISGQPQTGRFTDASAEERVFNIGYKVSNIERNWQAIHQNRLSCREVINTNPKPPVDFRVTVQ